MGVRGPSTAGRSPGAPHRARPGRSPALPARERAEASGAPTHLRRGCSRPGSSCRKCGAGRCVVGRSISARGRGAGPPARGTGRGLHPTVRGEPAPWAPRPEPCGAQCWAPPRVGVCFSRGASVSRQGPARRGHPESSHPVTSVEQIVYLMPAQCWATLEGTTEINLSWFFSSGCSSRLGNAITF